MNEHTAEPWHVVHNNWEVSSVYAASGEVARCHIDDRATEETQEVFEAAKEANAQRIVACVNACAGVSNAWLEGWGSESPLGRAGPLDAALRHWMERYAAASEEAEQLRAENARLREALAGIMAYEPEHCACGDDGCTQTRERYDAARAALRGGENV